MRAILFALLAALAPFPSAFAQGVTASTAEYKPRTFWNKLTFSSTYHTNAQLARNIEVVNSFDLNDFSAKVKEDELSALAIEGKITFGVLDKNSNAIKSAPADITTVSDLRKTFPHRNARRPVPSLTYRE